MDTYKEFGEGWSFGSITKFNDKENIYEVIFVIDDHSEEYPADNPELEEIIDAVYIIWMVNEQAEMEDEVSEDESANGKSTFFFRSWCCRLNV